MTPMRLAATLAAACILPILWLFHDRFWWPVDEGVYAYVAQQMLRGTRMHADLIDLHGGYGNLLNAAAMRLFGEDLLSMRYPLMAATALQSAIVFRLLQPRGALPAFAGAIAATAFGAPMFLNPSANWYALTIFFLTVLLLRRADPRQARDIILAGFLIGLCFLVRQLSGVFLAMAVLVWLLIRSEGTGKGNRIAPLFLGLLTAGGLMAYVLHKGSPYAIFTFGLWPTALALIAGMRARLPLSLALRWLLWGGAGLALAALPLTAMNAWNGVLGAWLHDMLYTALLINDQDFIAKAGFSQLLVIAIKTLASPPDAAAVVSGLAWLVLLALPPVCGYLAFRDFIRNGAQAQPLPVMASVWAVLAIHFQIPIYLFFVLAPLIVTPLLLSGSRLLPLAALALSLWALVFQAAQPLSRSIPEIIASHRDPATVPADLPRVSLRIPAQDRETFAALLARITATARPDEPLMTLPMDPELNFITGRPTPVRYYGTPLGLRSAADVTESFRILTEAAPIFIVNRRKDKYLTPLSADLLALIQAASPPPEKIGPFDLYRLPAP